MSWPRGTRRNCPCCAVRRQPAAPRRGVRRRGPRERPVDLAWINDIPSVSAMQGRPPGWRYNGTQELARHIAFTGDPVTAIASHGLEPLFPDLAEAALIMVGTPDRAWDRTDTPNTWLRTFVHELLRLSVARATGGQLVDLPMTYLTLARALVHWRGLRSIGMSVIDRPSGVARSRPRPRPQRLTRPASGRAVAGSGRA